MLYTKIKEVIQPHVPVRLPCYDLAHLAGSWFETRRDDLTGRQSFSGNNQSLTKNPLGWLDGQCVQGAGTYSSLDDDQRLLGISSSRGRVAALDPD